MIGALGVNGAQNAGDNSKPAQAEIELMRTILEQIKLQEITRRARTCYVALCKLNAMRPVGNIWSHICMLSPTRLLGR